MPVMVQARFLIFVVILKEHVLIKKNLFEVKQSELTTKGLNVGTQLRKKTSQKPKIQTCGGGTANDYICFWKL